MTEANEKKSDKPSGASVVYITLGFSHVHAINRKTLDKDCVILAESPPGYTPQQVARALFGNLYSMAYAEHEWDSRFNAHYPKGFVRV